MKRGEVEKLREQQYREEQEKLERERREKLAKRLGNADGQGAKGGSRTGRVEAEKSSEQVKIDSAEEEKRKEQEIIDSDYNIPNEEVIRRFRNRDEPIRLFAETDNLRIRRLRKLEAMEERTEGQRNDFRAAMQATDKGLALANLVRKVSTGDTGDAMEGEVEDHYGKKKRDRDAEKEVVDTSVISLDLLEKDGEKVRSLIAVYFKRVLREWEKSLNARPDDVKRSIQGKLQSANQAQSSEQLKPFFKQLKRGQIGQDVVARITEICSFMQQREYLQANDAYLRMSIGNAPWPIGVTMVGE